MVSDGAETTASSSVTRESASAVSRSASSISLRSAVALDGDAAAAASRRSLDDDVDVVAIARVGGHAPRRRVRVREHARCSSRSARSLRMVDAATPNDEALAQVLRADGAARGDVLLDDGPQDLLLPWLESQLTPP